jgi:hypothetical protein
MGLQAAVHLGHMPWALTKEEEKEIIINSNDKVKTIWDIVQMETKKKKVMMMNLH